MTEHGGNIYRYAEQLNISETQIIDFSASINPLGLPMSVVDEIQGINGSMYHYPDPEAKRLKEAIAAFYDIEANSIICGNGSTELIYLCVRALKPKRVIIPAPTFSEYERACLLSGAEIRYFYLKTKNSFDIESERFIKAMNGCDMAFICNPNNPTGRLIKNEELLEIAEAARQLKCYLVVDEAFIDFIPEHSIIKDVQGNPYLIVLRSMTKFYALSALRLGFGVFHPSVINMMWQNKEPWTVNTIAQIAGIAALKDNDYRKETFRIIHEGKNLMEQGLMGLSIDYIPSEVNYYLLKMPNAQQIISDLHKVYILTRDCSNFRGLDKSYIRVAVKSPEDINRLLKELSNLCEQ